MGVGRRPWNRLTFLIPMCANIAGGPRSRSFRRSSSCLPRGWTSLSGPWRSASIMPWCMRRSDPSTLVIGERLWRPRVWPQKKSIVTGVGSRMEFWRRSGVSKPRGWISAPRPWMKVPIASSPQPGVVLVTGARLWKVLASTMMTFAGANDGPVKIWWRGSWISSAKG